MKTCGVLTKLAIAVTLPISFCSSCAAFSTSTTKSSKFSFLDSLDRTDGFNYATKERSHRLDDMISTNPTQNPGSITSFTPIAPGTWKIIYAPHISALSGLLGGQFDPVVYDMRSDGVIMSHAKYDFPILGQGWLSVSGTYGTQDDTKVCRVEFDKAWIIIQDNDRTNRASSTDPIPVESFDEAPETWYKSLVNGLAGFGFRKEFAVFPVSYLDEDTMVFDFELLGTRICARKTSSQPFT